MSEPYLSFTKWTAFLDLDLPRLLPFTCITGAEWDHKASVLMMTLPPIAVYACVWAVLQGSKIIMARKPRGDQIQQFNSVFIQLMLLAYPAISREICKSFGCKTYDSLAPCAICRGVIRDPGREVPQKTHS